MGLIRNLRRFMVVVIAFAAFSPLGASGAATSSDDASPNPARQNTFHRSQSAGYELGTLRIPAIDVYEVFRSGVSMSVIDQGVAHWAGTSMPGGQGNVVLAGHRTTHSRPFHDLDRLRAGDLVFLTNGDGFEVIYRVADRFVVKPTDIWITYDFDGPTVTMFACHPKGSASQRIVVTAEMVAGRLIA